VPTRSIAAVAPTAVFTTVLAALVAACSSAPPPRPTPQQQYRLAFEPSDHEDTPCTERESASLLNALHTRVHNRITLPAGYVVVLPDGPQIAPLLQTDVMVALHPNGRILKSVVTKTSGAPAVDQAVISALQKAECMPMPPKEFLDPASNSMRIQVSYRFRRGK
jgi:TonB family protein